MFLGGRDESDLLLRNQTKFKNNNTSQAMSLRRILNEYISLPPFLSNIHSEKNW